MSITKGIVQGGNYTFSAANQTITFSSDYLGMSLSDITYITNITSGVATVIYDPFDVAKGGVLNGLTLTLAYNTTLMGDTDPLQIIVGFTPSNPAPINVNLTENPQLESQTELLSSMADAMDMLGKATDQAEGVQVNTREINPALRDGNNAQILSDGVIVTNNLSGKSNILSSIGSAFEVDTNGYNTVIFVATSSAASPSMSANIDTSVDRIVWGTTPFSLKSGAGSPYTPQIAGGAFGIFNASVAYYVLVQSVDRYVRLRLSAASSGFVTVYAILRNLLPGVGAAYLNTANIQNIYGYQGAVLPTLNNIGGSLFDTGIPSSGSRQPGSSVISAPVVTGGREAPATGSLAGTVRTLLTDPQGRYILGGDYDATRPRDPITGVATGPNNTAPIRGIGGRQNTMHGSQALLVEDVGQSEGDTTPTLLQQILVELKMLNQQINELPLTLNLGIKMQNEVSDYRTEEYNNHVNNQ